MYFYLPHPNKCRNRTDSKRWRGLAVILLADEPSRYFIGHRNITLLMAAENLRYVSAEEAMAAEGAQRLQGLDPRQETIMTLVRKSNHPRTRSRNKNGENAEIYWSKYEQERSQVLPKTVSANLSNHCDGQSPPTRVARSVSTMFVVRPTASLRLDTAQQDGGGAD